MSASTNQICAAPPPEALPEPVDVNGHGPKTGAPKNKLWEPNAIINIRFLGGEPELQARVKAVARQWADLTGLTFQFIDHGDADIRISFVLDNRSWSRLGTDCTLIKEPEATMNFGWLTPASTDTVLRAVVLHEFGHAIGLIHEHQIPKGNIQWNKDAVRHDLSGPPNNWDPATIEFNMFRQFPPDDVIATKVDFKSIMMYPVPASWTTNGTSAGFNTELSETDRQFVEQVYRR